MPCENGCLFCKTCIVRASDIAIGEGSSALSCLGLDCKAKFPLQSLQSAVPASR